MLRYVPHRDVSVSLHSYSAIAVDSMQAQNKNTVYNDSSATVLHYVTNVAELDITSRGTVK